MNVIILVTTSLQKFASGERFTSRNFPVHFPFYHSRKIVESELSNKPD